MTERSSTCTTQRYRTIVYPKRPRTDPASEPETTRLPSTPNDTERSDRTILTPPPYGGEGRGTARETSSSPWFFSHCMMSTEEGRRGAKGGGEGV